MYEDDGESHVSLPPLSSVGGESMQEAIPDGYVPHYVYLDGSSQPSIVYAPQFIGNSDDYVLYEDGHAEPCDVIEDLDLLGVEDRPENGMDVQQASANAPALAKLLAKMRNLQDDDEV